VSLRQQPGDDLVALDVVLVSGQQLLQLVEQQPDDAGLGRVQPGDVLRAAPAERPHASFW
jgi:hypothetical protein